jgi:nicotinamidase/pyrazinamidase
MSDTTIIRVDVDTQIGFCDPVGNLYVAAKPGTLENIRALVADAEARKIPLIGSVDSHAYDAWEFIDNGGPFPAHCVKGTPDWIKMPGTLPKRFRFVPMSSGELVIGENRQGHGNRRYGKTEFTNEVLSGVGIYFEKEVYSAFANPLADQFIENLVKRLGGGLLSDKETGRQRTGEVIFQVFGYCTGGFCVDGFVEGLLDRGYTVQVVLDATAPIDGVNGPDGAEYSRRTLTALGAKIITTAEALTA